MRATIKRCTEIELTALAEISRRTFVEAFEKDNEPDDFKNYIDSAFDKEKLRNELSNKDSHFYFVYFNQTLVGYFKLNFNAAQTDLNLAESSELERIYVSKEYQGKGIGKWILNKVKGIVEKSQKEFLWLGVWEKNTKAISFYQRNGFSKFGMHPYYIGNDKQMDWLMRHDLTNLNTKIENET